MRHKKIKEIFTNLMLVVISSVFTVAILEIVLSIGSYFYYPRLSVSDKALGWRYRPTPRKKVKRHSGLGHAYYLYMNKDGFRDDEFMTGKDCFRIMVLGDSMTFGTGVDQEEIFCSLLEKKIRKSHPHKKIDVMNFGTPGFGTGQELICLKEYADRYPPGVVILMLFEGNDFHDNTAILSEGRSVPHFIIRDDKLILCNSPNKSERALEFLRDKSVLFFILQKKLGIVRRITYKERDVSKQEMIVLMCKILEEIHSYTESKGAPLFIFYIKRNDFYGGKFSKIKQYCMDKNIFFKPVPWIRDETLLGYWGHWDSKGHNSAAEIIYDELSKRKVLDNLDE